MDETVQELIDRLEKRLALGDRLGAAFAQELAAVWKDAERALRQLLAEAQKAGVSAGPAAGRGAAMLAQVKEILERSGYDALVAAASSQATSALLQQALNNFPARQAAELVQSAHVTLNALRELATIELWAKGDETAVALWRSLAQHLFTTRPLPEVLQDLQDALDRDEAAIRALFDTQVSIFGRVVEDRATRSLGPDQPFLYLGPVHDGIRDWCLERVGKVFTRAEIEAMDNGQLPNPMLTSGGYNCLHSFIAIESQALRELVGTDKRVDVVARDVERLKERKAEKKKRAA